MQPTFDIVKTGFLALALVLMCATGLRAQSSRAFTSDAELSNSLINAIFCDRNGIIWIATEDGLNRYDGVKLTIYRHRPGDAHSLDDNYVRTLFEDRDGRLFVGTYNGVQVYDPRTDTFSALAHFKGDDNPGNYITGIVQRKNGEIWAAGNIMCRLVLKGGDLLAEKLDLPLPTTYVEDIMVDKDDNVWITRTGDGVYCMETNGRVRRYPVSGGLPFISILCEDREGNIYGGTPGNGVYRFDRQRDKFVPLCAGSEQNFQVKTLYAAKEGINIGTDGGGLKIYDNKSQRLTNFVSEEKTFLTANAKVHAICRDRTGNLWLGIYQKGVLMISPHKNGFKYWGKKSAARDIIGSDCVTAIYRDAAGVTFVGTDNDGLYIINADGTLRAHYSHTAESSSVPAVILSVFEDSNRNIWLGSFGGGAVQFNPSTGQCTQLAGLTGKNVYAFAEDSRKRLWIGTMGDGLFSCNLVSGEVSRLPDSDLWIGSLYYSAAANSLFVGTYSGMSRIDLSNDDFTENKPLYESIVYSFYEAGNTVWAGTSAGLQEWNQATDSLRLYTVDDGLCNNFVYAVQGSDDGCLWLGTSGGLARFSPDKGRFDNYYAGDGLQGNEFSKNASWRDNDGRLWFGGVNGITFFDPSEITTAERKRHVRITDFYIFGRPVRCGMKSGGKQIIDRPVFEAETFRLAHNDNAFTIEFSTVELDNAGRLVYEYSMNDSPWAELPHGTHQVSFSALSPGSYRFLLRCKDGASVSETKAITIIIAQPWWNTVWAWLVYAAVALAAILLAAAFIRHRYRERQERLRLLRAEQTNEEKLQFFINISHEIRTPMTLILSPLNQLMGSDDDGKRQKSYRTIRRNAERILNLVNQLMDVRKIDKGQMRLLFREEDLVARLEELYASFADVAEKLQIDYSFSHESLSSLTVWLDGNAFDKIIINILSNAFKFTPAKGKIDVSLATKDIPGESGPLAHCAEIIISDSGPGIAEGDCERIFERFYQTPGSLNYKGTGIGLHLTRSLANLLHGTVRAENKTGEQGSRFIVRLPLGNAHLSEEETAKTDNVTPHPTTAAAVAAEALSAEIAVDTNPAEDLPARSRQRILIVEDDAEIRRYLREELAAYRIDEASDGRQALEKIFQKAPDLIVSDVMMPEMDGITLCRKIKQNIRLNHIPIILLTAKTREEDNIEGLDVGADAYITKPFNLEVLRHTIKNILQGRDSLRNIYSGGQQAADGKMEKIDVVSPDERLMQRIMKVVNAHLADPALTIETMASETGLSRVHLHRKLKELTNQTPHDFLRNVRMKQAATLLAEKKHSISEVAALVGYTNLSTFSSAFKEIYGLSPSAYSKQQLE